MLPQLSFIRGAGRLVGDNAVGFDPTVSVVTDGAYLAVHDAVVTIYRTEVHQSLVALADRHWDGRSTARLGYDAKTWNEWLAREFEPYRQSQTRSNTSEPTEQ